MPLFNNPEIEEYLKKKYGENYETKSKADYDSRLDQLNSAQAIANLGDVIAGRSVGSSAPFFQNQARIAKDEMDQVNQDRKDAVQQYLRDKYLTQIAQNQELNRNNKLEVAAINRTPKPSSPKAEKDPNLTYGGNLRKEFQGLQSVKDYKNLNVQFEKIKKAAESPSAAGDISMIFSYMKMLDPGSTVREGEFANAQNAAGVDDRIKNMYNKVISGERLNNQQRADFVNQSQNALSAQRKGYDSEKTKYEDLAKLYKVDPQFVFGSQKQEQSPIQIPSADTNVIEMTEEEKAVARQKRIQELRKKRGM